MDGVGLKVFKFFQLLNMGFLKGKYSRYFAPSRQHIITPSYNINNTSALIVSPGSHIISVQLRAGFRSGEGEVEPGTLDSRVLLYWEVSGSSHSQPGHGSGDNRARHWRQEVRIARECVKE